MKEEKLYRGCKVRLFPTPEQEDLMWKHVHAARFMYNYMLDLQNGRYKNGRKHLSGFDMCNELKYMKWQPEFSWLKEVSHATLAQVCLDLDNAFKMFFKANFGKPNFKKKNKCKQIFPITPDGNKTYFLNEELVIIPKIGHVKCFASQNIGYGKGKKIVNPRIEYVKSSKKWILSFQLLINKQDKKLIDKSMGIDLGIKELAVVAVGDKKLVFDNINKSKRMKQLKKKRKHVQRAISRKYRAFNKKGTLSKGKKFTKSKDIEKYEQILREIDSKMSNIRKNYIHQITRQLVNMLPERVVMEDLNIQGLSKNKYLAKSISEQNFNFFIQTMKYKCEEYGIEFMQVDRFCPSSKTCSSCGHKKKDLKLKDRIYKCPNCGLEIDRDYNAAINLMNYTENKNTTDKLVTKVERKKKAQKTTIVSVV